MKYIKFIIENQNINEYIINNESLINEASLKIADAISNINSYVLENLKDFLSDDLNKSYLNIKSFALTESLEALKHFLPSPGIGRQLAGTAAGGLIGTGLVRGAIEIGSHQRLDNAKADFDTHRRSTASEKLLSKEHYLKTDKYYNPVEKKYHDFKGRQLYDDMDRNSHNIESNLDRRHELTKLYNRK